MAKLKSVENKGSSPFITSDPLNPQEAPELVFGIIAPVGVDKDVVCNALEQELTEYNYKTFVIRVSSTIKLVKGFKSDFKDEYDRIKKYMDAGTKIREKSGLNDALAILSVSEIARIRSEENAKEGKDKFRGREKTAYILNSLKTPDEIETLRAIYGRAFYLISSHSCRENRIVNLAKKISKSKLEPQGVLSSRTLAEALIARDEKEEGTDFGQNVQSAFPKADLFLNMDNRTEVNSHLNVLKRFLKILFGYPYAAPSKDEFGMFHAEAASWRSADLARQVGCSICSNSGELLTLGCNEVPKAFGGLYWEGDDGDARDYKIGKDEGAEQKRLIVAEILKRIKESGLIPARKIGEIDDLINKAIAGQDHELLEGLQALNVIEYGRTVHAEMAALSDAAKRGVSVDGMNLYVNTFPCHICARHIIASGIKRVVYVEPYPKSLTGTLYPDSIDMSSERNDPSKVRFEPFTGIAPRCYEFAFKQQGKRKDKSGSLIAWRKENATTKLKRFVTSYVAIESAVITDLLPKINKIQL
jgi:deoxycytidylate deaminase